MLPRSEAAALVPLHSSCVCVCVCVRVCVCVCARACLRAREYACVHACMHAFFFGMYIIVNGTSHTHTRGLSCDGMDRVERGRIR